MAHGRGDGPSGSGSGVSVSRMATMAALLVVFMCCVSAASAVTVGSLQKKDILMEINLPEISYEDLLRMDSSAALQTADSLVTVGAIQITNIPNFAAAKARGLGSVADCLAEDIAVPSSSLKDGSSRKVINAESLDGRAGAFTNKCGASADEMRALIDLTSYQLFVALDSLNFNPEKLMTPYKNFVDLTSHGDHLEHLHAYYGPQDPMCDASNKVVPTMELHTDSGLFIAMTTGSWNSVDSASDIVGGVYMRTPAGLLARMKAADDALIFMVGEGGQAWLTEVFGRPLRAVPHLLVADVSAVCGSGMQRTRSWYGKMFLPPGDAQIESLGMSYSSLRKKQTQIVTSRNSPYSLPVGCGDVQFSGYSLSSPSVDLGTNDDGCGSGQQRCWMQCYSLSALNLSCSDPVCVDTITDTEADPNEMCPSGVANCKLMCGFYSLPNKTGFCSGAGQSMDMKGFVSTATTSDPPCFNLLFTDFTLSSETKFAAGCIGVFFLGITIQLLTQYRAHVAKAKVGGVYNKPFTVILYGIQVTLSYFIMLVAMTYSSELFAMVICGLTVGYGLANWDASPLFSSKKKAGGHDDEDGNCCGDHNNDDTMTERLVYN
jgi:hypothetical protein